MKKETSVQKRLSFLRNLPESINNEEEAVKFLTELTINGYAYHPEDDAHDIIWHMPLELMPSIRDKDRLNKLMGNIYEIDLSFDPCGFLIDIGAYE